MELVPKPLWVNLVNCLAMLFARGGNGLMFSMPFKKDFTGGTDLEVKKTFSNMRSAVHCAELCKEDREENYQCQGFRYLPVKNTCELYTEGTITLAYPGVEIFMFEVQDGFHNFGINGRRYSVYLSGVYRNFTEARDHCTDLGGYLLEFDSLDEYQAVETIVSGCSYDKLFVGANDIDLEDNWVTDSDGVGIETDKWIWGDGQPDTSGSNLYDCASFSTTTFKLYDTYCYNRLGFLCERDVL